MKTTYNVLIDNKPETLTHVYTSKGGLQYNTKGNNRAFTFNHSLDYSPKNKPIKTNGITLIILD